MSTRKKETGIIVMTGTSAWDLDLSGHNHKHICRKCDATIWHVGTKAECDLLDPLCVDCLDELVRNEEGTL